MRVTVFQYFDNDKSSFKLLFRRHFTLSNSCFKGKNYYSCCRIVQKLHSCVKPMPEASSISSSSSMCFIFGFFTMVRRSALLAV